MLWIIPILIIGCKNKTADPKKQPIGRKSPGLHYQILNRDNGKQTKFTIWIPPKHSPEKPTPLILALHFGGPVSDFYGQGVLDGMVRPALQELDAIIIAPDSVGGGWASKENQASVLALLDAVKSTYSIDQNKTLVTGYSMGGHGTWYFAAQHGDKFTAAIPIAGRPADATEIKIPIRAINSTNDQVVRIGPAQKAIENLRKSNPNADIVVIENATHYQRQPFVEALQKLKPWIEDVWDKNAAIDNSADQ